MAKQTDINDAWTGWIGFAAIMLALVGIFHMIAGFAALFKEDIYTATPNAIWMFDYSQWGWVHVLGGLLAFLAAGSLVQGQLYGRIVAILVAVASVVANMAFVPIYPIWSILMIILGIVVIWAVAVHGGELQE